MSRDRVEPRLICHYLKVDPEDGGEKAFSSRTKHPARGTLCVKGLPICLLLSFIK